MARKLLDGWSFVRIAAWLDETGARTNKDRSRGETKIASWTVPMVIDALTSPRTQGLKLHTVHSGECKSRGDKWCRAHCSRGEVVLDGSGEPIRLAPPTFDPDTWKQIQAAAALRKQNQRKPTGTTNPMLGIGLCGRCGKSLAQSVLPDNRRYYRCAKKCRKVFLRADIGDELLEETFLREWGDTPVTRRVFVQGEDHSHELEQVRATIDRLRRESDAGLVVSEEDERVDLARMRSLIERRSNWGYAHSAGRLDHRGDRPDVPRSLAYRVTRGAAQAPGGSRSQVHPVLG